MSMTHTTQTREAFVIDLNPTVPLAEHIRSGSYTYVHPAINPRNFTLTLSGMREVVLYDPRGFDPRGFASSAEMIAGMKNDGYVPAVIDDALAFGAAYPDRQRTNTIVFLGTVWCWCSGLSCRLVPVLVGSDTTRVVSLDWFGSGWVGSYRFAAVRES